MELQKLLEQIVSMGMVPVTGDRFRPWIAAIILIVSVIVLVTMLVIGKNKDSQEEDYQDEDD